MFLTYMFLYFTVYAKTRKKRLDVYKHKDDITGFVQDCSNSIANAMELLQSCANQWYK